MKTPSIEAMSTAWNWLLANEGLGSEREHCQQVAEWIELQIKKAEEKQEAKLYGVSVAMLRKAKKLAAAKASLP